MDNALLDAFDCALQEELKSDTQPILLIIAGHNGAGKTTYYRARIRQLVEAAAPNMVYINADDIERELREVYANEGLTMETDEAFSLMARHEAQAQRDTALQFGQSYCFETVASHPSKIDEIKQARASNYVVVLIFVGLESAEKSAARVAARVKRNGHHVAPEKIAQRYPRVLNVMRTAVRVASISLVIDNSQEDDPDDPAYHAFALFHQGKLSQTHEPIPAWASIVISDAPRPKLNRVK